MATSKIIKNVPLLTVVKVLGPGTTTIDLRDLKTSTQDFDRGNVKVNINTIYYTANGFITYSRNSNVILKTEGSDNWFFSAASGIVLDEDNNANITVTFNNGSDGSVILALSKVAGYSPNVALGADGVQEFISGN
jgi:hypothetical protein